MRVLVFLSLAVALVCAGYGDPASSASDQFPQGDLPTRETREAFTLLNFLRGDREWWRANAMPGFPGFSNQLKSGKNREPLLWERRLAGVCEWHTLDMGQSSPAGCSECCESLETCDNVTETYVEQMINFGYPFKQGGSYSGWGWVDLGSSTPYEFIRSAICEADINGICESDSDATFRKYIYDNPHASEVSGVGMSAVAGSDYGIYWEVLAARNPSIAPPTTNKIASGSTVDMTPNQWHNGTAFVASYRGRAREAAVVIGGTKHAMTKIAKGETYAYVGSPAACSAYAFMFVDRDGTAYRYPEGGNLQTGGACSEWTSDTATCGECAGICFTGNCMAPAPDTSGASGLAIGSALLLGLAAVLML